MNPGIFSHKQGILFGVIPMSRYFHGNGRTGPYFEGWYFKCRTKAGKAMALIPAFHMDSRNRPSASLQVIADSGTWWLEYPAEEFDASPEHLLVRVGSNTFSEGGLELKIQRPGITLRGKLDFGPFTPLQSDIMGPFQFLPHMECTHGVISMAHSLQGKLTLNGEVLTFNGGAGYIETDRGSAFPDAYLWAQSAFSGGNLMLSVATVPLAGIRFTGCICALLHNGKEYRLATYRGVRAERWSENGAVLRQGKYRLEVEVLDKQPQPLRAPVNDTMGRTIHESLRTKLRCRFWVGDTLLFDRTDSHASFEYSDTEAET